MSRVARGSPSGDAYLDLQNEARRTGRPTQELRAGQLDLGGGFQRGQGVDAANRSALSDPGHDTPEWSGGSGVTAHTG